LGGRVKFEPTDNLTLLFGAYNDDPAGPCANADPQVCDPHGLNFRLKDEPLLIAEAQFKYRLENGTAGLVRFGAFEDFGTFADQHFDEAGVSLADRASSGTPRRIRSDRGAYGIIEQRLAAAGTTDEKKGVWFFTRSAVLPSDRNLVDFFAEAGITFLGVVRGRPGDEFGVAASYSHISDAAAALDRDAVALGTAAPIRDYEAVLELTYKAEIVPGLFLQPDFSYIWHPGGNAPNPNDPTRAIPNAAVMGLRSTINY
jgi:porin